MAANNGDLVQSLIEGGLAPQAARILGNVLANANSPAFSKGQDEEDASLEEQVERLKSGGGGAGGHDRDLSGAVRRCGV